MGVQQSVVTMWFDVIIPLWSPGMFAYPQLGAILSLAHNFYRAGAQISLDVLMCLVVMIYKRLTEVLSTELLKICTVGCFSVLV